MCSKFYLWGLGSLDIALKIMQDKIVNMCQKLEDKNSKIKEMKKKNNIQTINAKEEYILPS